MDSWATKRYNDQVMLPGWKAGWWRFGQPERWITVCWTQDRVSFCFWLKEAGKLAKALESKQLPACNLNARSYVEILEALTGKQTGKPVRIIWMLMFTPMETASGSAKAGGYPVMPDWMEACWKQLPLSLMPSFSCYGLDCIVKQLRDWDPMDNKGTGVYFEALGKGYFFGFGEQETFHRISRPAKLRADPDRELDADWCQQTRMLYRNRTGLELKRILLPWTVKRNSLVVVSGDIELIPVLSPVDVANLPGAGMSEALAFLHYCLLQAEEGEDFIMLEDPVRSYRGRSQSVSTMKTGIYLLACGWVLLFLGACQNFNRKSGQDPALHEDWNREKAEWKESNKRYRKHLADVSDNALPYKLVAEVAANVPQQLELERIHLWEPPVKSQRIHYLRVEGRFHDAEPNGEFRQWIESFKDDLGSGHEQLRLTPDESGLRFQFDCEVPRRGEFQ